MSQHHKFTWPRLPDIHHHVACHYCDTLHDVDLIAEGQAAHCTECGAILYRNHESSLPRAVAYAITALACFTLMMIFPFISLNPQGNGTVVSIPGAVTSLWAEGGQFIAVNVALFVIILPFLELISLTLLCVPLLFGRAFPKSRRILSLFQNLQSWAMVEVFFLGAIVSLLKLTKLADIGLGIGFWSVAGLMVCLAGAIGGIDRIELWDRIETAETKRGIGS